MAAAKPMTKGQILDHMAKKTGVTKKVLKFRIAKQAKDSVFGK